MIPGCLFWGNHLGALGWGISLQSGCGVDRHPPREPPNLYFCHCLGDPSMNWLALCFPPHIPSPGVSLLVELLLKQDTDPTEFIPFPFLFASCQHSFSDMFGGRKKEDQNSVQEEITALLRPDPHLHRTHSHEKSWSNQNKTSQNDTVSVNTYLKLCARSFPSIISQLPWEVGYETQSPYSFPHLLMRQPKCRKVKQLVQLLQ